MCSLSYHRCPFPCCLPYHSASSPLSSLALHDALPICSAPTRWPPRSCTRRAGRSTPSWCARRDRKSTRLNSSHVSISYAAFCLKKKNVEDLVQHGCTSVCEWTDAQQRTTTRAGQTFDV